MSFVDPASSASATSSTPPKPTTAADDDLDPAAFLKSVRELSEKREREDAERYRKLEEEVEQGRRERAARRLERARSISPKKKDLSTSEKTPSRSSTIAVDVDAIAKSDAMDPTAPPPPPESPTKDIPEFKGFSSRTPTQREAAPSRSESSASSSTQSASTLARSGTLSWQQRPSSRGVGSRPKSMVLPETAKATNGGSAAAKDDTEPSRDQIAASLSSRDPSWFRQTADRGLGNAAYRKGKDEAESGDSFASGRRGLPGMSRDPPSERAMDTSPARSDSVTSGATSRFSSVRDGPASSTTFSTVRSSTSSKPDLKSLIATDQEQEKISPMSEKSSSQKDGEQSTLGRTMPMSSSQARLADSFERPASPTKGMGGFVQSAMMKRSDSASKRWSAQPGTSLSRGNSTAGTRSGLGGLTGSYSMPKLEPTPASRDGSAEPSSRPASSNSNLANLAGTHGKEDDVFVKPELPTTHSRSKSITASYSTNDMGMDEGRTSPSSSPSKRWSPSKSRSTWLESAITKPDSPKPAPAPRNTQPSWMADIAKAKAQRASGDITPKPAEESGSRPGSPTKAPFGQSMLKRSESRDLGTPRSLNPKPLEESRSRPTSPTKANVGLGLLSRSDSIDLGASAVKNTQVTVDSRAVSDEAKVEPTPEPTKSAAEVEKQDFADMRPTEIAEKSAPLRKESLPSPAKPVSTPSISTKPKPETPPKPQTDFRSTLRSRAPTETKPQETPEFLSKFGTLKKTTTQNYVASDLLKDNILRGKSDLTKTGGPVKTQRRDELKESLLAKKEQWKKEKEEGTVHERKTSNPLHTPQKPEALAKRELLGRSESVRTTPSPEKPKSATPEALARHRSIKESKPAEASLPGLEKQTSTPADITSTSKQANETSKLAARFNPALAGILARGPSPNLGGSDPSSRSEKPAMPQRAIPTASNAQESAGDGGQLQDVRKGRAKGPKRRKGGAAIPMPDAPSEAAEEPQTENTVDSPRFATTEATPQDEVQSPPIEKPKPRAPPGSAASVMLASLQKRADLPSMQRNTETTEKPIASLQRSTPSTPRTISDKQSIPAKSPGIPNGTQNRELPSTPVKATPSQSVTQTPVVKSVSVTSNVADFKGFGSSKTTPPMRLVEDNKENAGDSSPSVKSAAALWGKPSSPKKTMTPGQVPLPSRKDEEAAMRSAGLLSSSPTRPSSSSGPASAVVDTSSSSSSTIPPKPPKPSRIVSGQLQEASPNKDAQPSNAIEKRLQAALGSVPEFSSALSVDVHGLIANSPHQDRIFKTVKKAVYVAVEDGSLTQLPPHEEYTFFDSGVYACHHSYSIAGGPKKNEIFLWAGSLPSADTVERAQARVKQLAKEANNAFVHFVRQAMEPPGFLQALGGILVTRKGSRKGASKQYMLCGRKHLGQIVFDETEFGISSLCSGFAYLISFPVTLQETKMYLWKGSASSTEEVSAARLAAMDLSESGDIIEVDDGAEFASFLKIFGAGTTKASVPKATEMWQAKAQAPDTYGCRLFSVRAEEAKQGFFGGMFARRPSWNSQSPSRGRSEEVKVSVQQISPFSQSNLDVDGIYLLDAHSQIWILIGPMFSSHPETVRATLFGQTLMLASEYALVATSTEDRAAVPKGHVLLSGLPKDLKMLFRQWDDGVGLWGTAQLMAGSRRQDEVEYLGLDEVLDVVCTQ